MQKGVFLPPFTQNTEHLFLRHHDGNSPLRQAFGLPHFVQLSVRRLQYQISERGKVSE